MNDTIVYNPINISNINNNNSSSSSSNDNDNDGNGSNDNSNGNSNDNGMKTPPPKTFHADDTIKFSADVFESRKKSQATGTTHLQV